MLSFHFEIHVLRKKLYCNITIYNLKKKNFFQIHNAQKLVSFYSNIMNTNLTFCELFM